MECNDYGTSVLSATAVIISLLFFLPTHLHAQQEGQDIPQNIQKFTEQLIQQMEGGESSDEEHSARKGKVDFSSLGHGPAHLIPDQEWIYGQSFNAKYNFKLDESGQYAGDINNDGATDYIIFTESAADERTADLNDTTPKTAVFYGSNNKTGNEPDQLFYRKIIPVGDLDDDGYADAIGMDGNNAPTIFNGTDSGYSDSGTTIFVSAGSSERIQGFVDINGDGYGDFIKHEIYSDDVVLFLGSPDLSNINTVYYTPGSLGQYVPSIIPKEVNATDFTNDGSHELVLFGQGESFGMGEVHVISYNSSTGEFSLEQQFAFSGMQQQPEDNLFRTIDITGDGNDELFIGTPNGSKQVFEFDTGTSAYNTTPVSYFNGELTPVGDLNNDGHFDFIQPDPNNENKPYISFGSSDLGATPGLDVELTGDSDTNWGWSLQLRFPGLVYNETYGDLDGDGIDDVLMGHTQETENTIGRRLLSGSESGSYSSAFVHYPLEDFYDKVSATYNIGDFNNDGIEDIAFERSPFPGVEIYWGGSSISSSPDLTLDINFANQGLAAGDFDGDGISDIVVSAASGEQVAIFKGGDNPDGTPDQTIYAENVLSQPQSGYRYFYNVNSIDDVNNDGRDDFIMGSIQSVDSTAEEYYNEAYLFLGGDGSFPTQHSQIISISDQNHPIAAGINSSGLGDVNDDGVDDFAVSSITINDSETSSSGEVKVFFGGADKSYSSADLTLTPPNNMLQLFGWGLTGADISGDGTNDIAVGAGRVGYESTSGFDGLFIYNGGSSIDDQHDRSVSYDLNGDGLPDEIQFPRLQSMGDNNNNDLLELLITTQGSPNAIVMERADEGLERALIVDPPNTNALLGGNQGAVGDFDGNGTRDLVLTQPKDNNDAYRSSRVYRYAVPVPLEITKVEDVPDDQGGWVRVHVDGYLMEAMKQEYYGLDNWAVWRQTGDGSYTQLQNVQAFHESSKYVDVHVPTTQQTGQISEDDTYIFKVTAHRSSESVIAQTDTASGYALDNIAPGQVSGVSASRTTDGVQMRWNVSEANDIGTYSVHRLDPSGEVADTASTTIETAATLPDSGYTGVHAFAVRGQDVHRNTGDLSSPKPAVFPVDVNYDILQGWNMVGLPLNVESQAFDTLAKDIQAGNLYYYDGSYKQVKDISDIKQGQGYWGKFPDADKYNMKGLPVAEMQIELNKGWNLISGVGESLSADQISDPDGIIIQGTVQGFNGGYAQASQLTPGQAYWIRTSDSGTITLSLLDKKISKARQLEKEKAGDALAEAKENFNKLIIRYSEDRKRTLYFGNKLSQNVDRRSFTLPPAPPGSAFDARFYQTSRTLLQQDEFMVRLSRGEGTNLSMELQLNTQYDFQTFEVQEIKDGAALDEYLVDGSKPMSLKNSDTELLKFKPLGLNELSASESPDEFKLHRNYPNPFNPATTIRYSIPEASGVNLEVYNILGEKVATLVDEQQSAGNYKVRFNASDLSSGLYFVKIDAGSYQSVQKITLIK